VVNPSRSAQHYALIAHKLFTSEKASWFDDDDEEETKEFAWIVNASGQRIGSIEDAGEQWSCRY
jgi:hypothetical protein